MRKLDAHRIAWFLVELAKEDERTGGELTKKLLKRRT